MQALLGQELKPGSTQGPERPGTALVLKHYAVSSVLYGLLLAFLTLNPWFKSLLGVAWAGVTAWQFYAVIYFFYVVGALPMFLVLRPPSLCGSKNLLVFGWLCRAGTAALQRLRGGTAPGFTPSELERQALMWLLIRLCFGPLIVNTLLVELTWCQRLSTGLHPVSFLGRLDVYYIVLIHVLFLADASLYFVGYHSEAACLRNQVRFVETNLWRILVCMACYAPFSQATMSLLGASCQDPYILVQGNFQSVWTWLLRLLALGSLGLLFWSDLSLFTRAGNLYHRGLVTWGAYRFVRHPGYLAQNLFWFATLMPGLIPSPHNVYFSWGRYSVGSLGILGGFGGWAAIYWLRALAEEQFLSRDPEYAAYCQRVRYRFVPGLY